MSNSESDREKRPEAEELNDSEPFDPLFLDPVIEAYKKDLDVTLLDRTLRLSVAERAQQLVKAANFLRKFRPLAANASQEQ